MIYAWIYSSKCKMRLGEQKNAVMQSNRAYNRWDKLAETSFK